MKNFIVIISTFFFFFIGLSVYAQSDEQKESVIHIGFWDPIGTNGKWSKQYTNTFSFNVLYGQSRAEKTFVFSGLGSSIERDANGVQIAGLATVIGGNARGLTFSGLVNIMQNSTGVAVSGLSNISQDINGMQFTGLANISQNVKGVQIAGLANISQNVSGFQFSGLSNISQNLSGIQISGLGNISQNTHGFQFSGLGNISERMSGIQIAGIGNAATDVNGVQFAGIYNKAKYVRGVQFAGIVNIADQCDYPIGLVNIIKNGEKSIGITFDEIQNLMATFRSGGRIMYGILGVGYNFKSSHNLMSLEGGFGAHINCTEKFRVNTELVGTVMTKFDNAISRSSLRILPSYKFTPNFEIFAGPTFNYMQTGDEKFYDMFPKHSVWKDMNASGDKSQLYFGYLAGLQFVF